MVTSHQIILKINKKLSHENKKLPLALREKCPYSEIFWFVFSWILTEYGEIHRISPYSVRIQENTNQKNSEYGHFSRSVNYCGMTFNQS